MTTIALILFAAVLVLGFLLACALVGYDDQREELLDDIDRLEAQVAGLEAMNSEKHAEIRRLRMGRHPAGRALRVSDAVVVVGHVDPAEHDNVVALREACEERDAEHEGGEGA